MNTKKKNPFMFFGIIVLFLILCLAAIFFINKKTEEAQVDKLKMEIYEPVTFDFNLKNQPFIGNADAPVSIVEFGDYKCPSCAAWKAEIYPEVKKKFIDTGKAKLYFIHFPIPSHGEDALKSAVVGESIYAQSMSDFEIYYNTLYNYAADHRQGKPSTEEWITDTLLEKEIYPKLKNTNIKLLKQDIKKKKYLNEVEKDMELVKDAKVQGTPTLYINNVLVEGITKNSYGKAVRTSTPFDLTTIEKMINEGSK